MKPAKHVKPAAQEGLKTFVAGCGRQQQAPADLPEVAYIELAFAECPACIHRLEPKDAKPFCRWLPADRPHPFAGLADLVEHT